MADNVAITAGSGTTIAADELTDGTLGTVKVQYVKLMDGTLDGTTKAAVGANGLKVDGSGATQPVSGTVTVQQSTASSLKVDLSGTAVNATAIKTDGSAVNQPVTAAEATATTGTITTSSSTVAASVVGYSHVGISINGTYAGVNVTFEFSDDSGTTWYGLQVTRSDSSVVESTSGVLANASRAWDCTVPSCTNFRVRATAYTSGTASVRIIPSAFPSVYNIAGNLRVTDATAANFLPTMDAAARRGFVGVTDGTSSAAVKAASTAPVATDPALVVGISPNSPTLLVQSVAGTSGGWSVNSQTGLTNTKVAVKASAGTFAGYMLYNPSASASYVQVFDVASGSVTLGTTPPTYVIGLPAGAAANVEFKVGIPHATAITLAATATATGSTAPATALTGFFLFK
jgi:hypothetical protein